MEEFEFAAIAASLYLACTASPCYNSSGKGDSAVVNNIETPLHRNATILTDNGT